ncbi:MAG: tRNA 4-thiouridine(8) synthase ThiI [Calditrichaeota bacterium]|nr:MAG: tRNA 4-thiouridine(8) synthase ThiI [Calditrichota bacterium]
MNQTAVAELPAAARRVVLLHYSEIGLKGKNRHRFEQQLIDNIKLALSDLWQGRIQRLHGRFLLPLADEALWPAVKARLQQVFGLANFSPAVVVPAEKPLIEQACLALMARQRYGSFRVHARRAQKNLPFTSQQLQVDVGAAIQAMSGARVDLSHPEVTCYIEVTNDQALVYTEKVSGARGLPVGVSERAMVLLSSGIDSPVASWKMLKRGVRLSYVHFHSIPFTSEASLNNTRRLLQVLTRYQYRAVLYAVPFLPVQQAIMVNAPPDYRVVLYRRFMFRIAERLAHRERCQALVTGESIGQVASQTLTNLRVISQVCQLPVLRPLAGDDKEEIVALARQIGTFEISTEPYEDCCSLYVPRHPTTAARLETVQEIEARLPVAELVEAAVREAQKETFRFPATETSS